MTRLIIKTGTEADFFRRGLELARTADRGGQLSPQRVVSFEDPAEMMKVVTEGRLALFRCVKDAPGSITDIAVRLKRDRSAVKRDVDALENVGLLTVTERVLPGHGRMKEVRVVADRFSLRADVA